MVHAPLCVALIGSISFISMVSGFHHSNSYLQSQSRVKMVSKGDNINTPSTSSVPVRSLSGGKDWTKALKTLSYLGAVAIPLLSSSSKAKAVGDLFEFKDQTMVIQDISFNVGNTLKDSDALAVLFQNNIRTLRTDTANNLNTTVLGFGPDAYKSPSTFVPGISTFYEDGGHATITLKSKNLVKDSDVVEIFEKGNGLQFIKVGAEVIRLSKAIEKDVNVKFAYGWVDADTPGGIPLEVIIGIARDPVMLTCLRVSNVAASTKFFTEELGMKVLPFPISRQKGSSFEPEPVPGSSYVGYGDNSMGLLLTPSPKLRAPPLVVGTMLEAFTLVFDDSTLAANKLPPAVKKLLADGSGGVIKSPDGYKFALKGYEIFKKESTKSVDF